MICRRGGMAMRLVWLLFLAAPLLHAQLPALTNEGEPVVVTFVAPAYPRLAKENRIKGTAIADITVDAEGRVTNARMVSAHPVFANQVLTALKQWRLRASKSDYHLMVQVEFELTDRNCSDGTTTHPLPSETYVSAELPRTVHVKTAALCIEASSSQQRH